MSKRSEAVLFSNPRELNFSATRPWHLPAENSQLGKGFVVRAPWSNENVLSNRHIWYPLRFYNSEVSVTEAGTGDCPAQQGLGDVGMASWVQMPLL